MDVNLFTFGTLGDVEPFRLIAGRLAADGHNVVVYTDRQNFRDFAGSNCQIITVVDSSRHRSHTFDRLKDLPPAAASRILFDDWLAPTIRQFNLVKPRGADVSICHQFLRGSKNLMTAGRTVVFVNCPFSRKTLDFYGTQTYEVWVGISPQIFNSKNVPENVSLTGFVQAPQHPGKEKSSDSSGRLKIIYASGTLWHGVRQILDNHKQFAGLDAELILQSPHFSQVKGQINGNIELLGYADHVELFRKADLIIHNAGIGTIAKIIYSAKPCLSVPQYGDQFANARILEMHGISAGTWHKDSCVKSLVKLLEKSVEHLTLLRTNAQKLREEIEDERALDWISERISQMRPQTARSIAASRSTPSG